MGRFRRNAGMGLLGTAGIAADAYLKTRHGINTSGVLTMAGAMGGSKLDQWRHARKVKQGKLGFKEKLTQAPIATKWGQFNKESRVFRRHIMRDMRGGGDKDYKPHPNDRHWHRDKLRLDKMAADDKRMERGDKVGKQLFGIKEAWKREIHKRPESDINAVKHSTQIGPHKIDIAFREYSDQPKKYHVDYQVNGRHGKHSIVSREHKLAILHHINSTLHRFVSRVKPKQLEFDSLSKDRHKLAGRAAKGLIQKFGGKSTEKKAKYSDYIHNVQLGEAKKILSKEKAAARVDTVANAVPNNPSGFVKTAIKFPNAKLFHPKGHQHAMDAAHETSRRRLFTKEYPISRVPLDSIISGQTNVFSHIVKAKIMRTWGENKPRFPVFIKLASGKHFLVDGNHRTQVRAWRNMTHVRGHVIDYDDIKESLQLQSKRGFSAFVEMTQSNEIDEAARTLKPHEIEAWKKHIADGKSAKEIGRATGYHYQTVANIITQNKDALDRGDKPKGQKRPRNTARNAEIIGTLDRYRNIHRNFRAKTAEELGHTEKLISVVVNKANKAKKKQQRISEGINDPRHEVVRKIKTILPGITHSPTHKALSDFAGAYQYGNMDAAAHHFKSDSGAQPLIDGLLKMHSHYHNIHGQFHQHMANMEKKQAPQSTTNEGGIPSRRHFMLVTSHCFINHMKKDYHLRGGNVGSAQRHEGEANAQYEQLKKHYHTPVNSKEHFSDMWSDVWNAGANWDDRMAKKGIHPGHLDYQPDDEFHERLRKTYNYHYGSAYA
jgi:hypothetical protein